MPLIIGHVAVWHKYGEAYVLAANGIATEDAVTWFEAMADEYWERWRKERNVS